MQVGSIVGLVGWLEGVKDFPHKWDRSCCSQSLRAVFVNFFTLQTGVGLVTFAHAEQAMIVAVTKRNFIGTRRTTLE